MTEETAAPPATNPLFTDGRNCWQQPVADAFGWAIDGDDYFRAVRDAIGKAEREIVIVGWDIDSRLELVRDRADARYPSPLCMTLQSLVADNDALRVYVLSWDFALVYVLERELLPARAFGWQDSERLHFKLDGNHATGASHHQKLVIVDGALAFSGGLDLTKDRWDTREHSAGDDRRIDTEGNRYPPFHDVQAVVTGPAAECLRLLASRRWQNATGEPLPRLDTPPAGAGEKLWPGNLPVRARDVTTAIARTWAEPDGSGQSCEVEASFLDMIAAARQSIYIENQYFTSESISKALAERLGDEHGPEIVMVLPKETSGWLEQATMDVLRNKALDRLRRADAFDRLRVVSPIAPDGPGKASGTPINVHAKVTIVDNRYARIGSANLSARSMGLDSECDLVVDDRDAALALCADLLAEHLEADAAAVREQLASEGLLAVLDGAGDDRGRLVELDPEAHEAEQIVLEPIAKIADLEKPLVRAGVDSDDDDMHTPAGGWLFLAGLAAVAAFWVFLGVQGTEGDVRPGDLLSDLRELSSHWLAPVIAIPAFVAGSLVVAPVTGMIAVCALLFDPWVASIVAIAGVLAATAVNHWIGRHFGRFITERVPPRVAERIERVAGSSDIWSLAGLRLIPVAPFTIVNVVVGVSGVSLRDFLVGTLISMSPGIVLICLSVDRARAALAGEPVFDPWIVAAIAGAGIALIALRIWRQRRSA